MYHKNYKYQEKTFLKLNKTILKSLNSIIWFKSKYNNIFPRQDTIAKSLNCSRESVNRSISILEKTGLISHEYRHMTSCIYKLSHIFFNREFWLKARKYLPALNSLLFVMVTQLNSKDIMNKDYLYLQAKNLDQNPILKELVMNSSPEFIISRCLKSKIPTRSLYSDKINLVGDRLNLTYYAKTKLLGFSNEVISKAYFYYLDREVNEQFNIKNPYSLMFNLCYSVANELKKPFDRQLVARLLDHFGFNDAAMLYTEGSNKQIKREHHKKGNKKVYRSFLWDDLNKDKNKFEHRSQRCNLSPSFEKYLGNNEFNKYKKEMSSFAKIHIDKIIKFRIPSNLSFAEELKNLRKKVITNSIKHGKIL